MRRHWRKHSMLPLRRRRRLARVLLMALAFLTGLAGTAAATDMDEGVRLKAPLPRSHEQAPPQRSREQVSRQPSRGETLWIFDADFEDLLGDNAGWLTEDRSGTPAIENYWHKDTIRINGFTHLGDSTWWCGTYNACWRQPRGYGNDWYQLLERDFPEVAAFTDPGDILVLEYDQRYAIESDYDYGYTDISTDGGETWTTLLAIDNPGFAGTPGMSQGWNSVHPVGGGHMVFDLSGYAGQLITLRFRFESDGAYSSQDQYNNPPMNSCKDGAWQLDNIMLTRNDTLFWLDDCESPGSAGWRHDDIPAQGQTGVSFWRGLYGTDIWTNRAFSCDERSGWMYAAVDPATSRMVDDEYAWLTSPPINIEGATALVGQWDMWMDLPLESNDIFNLWIASNDEEDCVQMPDGFVDEAPGWWWGGPYWTTVNDNWSAFAGNDWLAIGWTVGNGEPPEPGAQHWGGIFLNRQRVGIPTGDFGTTWEYSTWHRFKDWFVDQVADALLDSAEVIVHDADDIASVTLVADNGTTQSSYSCRREHTEGNTWIVPTPATEMVQGAEIHYWFEAADGVGTPSVFPSDAPDQYYEFSILPAAGSVGEPGILLVDKHNQRTPGENRRFDETAESYLCEALEVLGHEYDVYDVRVPGGTSNSEGPDTCGMKYYDTQIWFTSSQDGLAVPLEDQARLAQWLAEASSGKERNLLVTGNSVAGELGADSLGFLQTWLAAEFVDDSVGDVTADSLPTLRDASGDFDFMTFDDRKCVLRGGCPEIAYFDVIQPYPGTSGAELAVEYVKADMTTRPAGVAYTDTSGYQTVTLGFGIEFMSDALLPTGHFLPGAADRADLIANIMEYFEKDPTAPGTGTEGGETFVTRLEPARPNPFNPRTTIAFSLAAPGRATVRVFSASGRLVTTLIDDKLEAGPHEVTWDGVDSTGRRVASGVYFVRLEAVGDSGAHGSARKLVLLK